MTARHRGSTRRPMAGPPGSCSSRATSPRRSTIASRSGTGTAASPSAIRSATGSSPSSGSRTGSTGPTSAAGCPRRGRASSASRRAAPASQRRAPRTPGSSPAARWRGCWRRPMAATPGRPTGRRSSRGCRPPAAPRWPSAMPAMASSPAATSPRPTPTPGTSRCRRTAARPGRSPRPRRSRAPCTGWRMRRAPARARWSRPVPAAPPFPPTKAGPGRRCPGIEGCWAVAFADRVGWLVGVDGQIVKISF